MKARRLVVGPCAADTVDHLRLGFAGESVYLGAAQRKPRLGGQANRAVEVLGPDDAAFHLVEDARVEALAAHAQALDTDVFEHSDGVVFDKIAVERNDLDQEFPEQACRPHKVVQLLQSLGRRQERVVLEEEVWVAGAGDALLHHVEQALGTEIPDLALGRVLHAVLAVKRTAPNRRNGERHVGVLFDVDGQIVQRDEVGLAGRAQVPVVPEGQPTNRRQIGASRGLVCPHQVDQGLLARPHDGAVGAGRQGFRKRRDMGAAEHDRARESAATQPPDQLLGLVPGFRNARYPDHVGLSGGNFASPQGVSNLVPRLPPIEIRLQAGETQVLGAERVPNKLLSLQRLEKDNPHGAPDKSRIRSVGLCWVATAECIKKRPLPK